MDIPETQPQGNFMTPEDLRYLPQKPFAPKPMMLDFPIPHKPSPTK